MFDLPFCEKILDAYEFIYLFRANSKRESEALWTYGIKRIVPFFRRMGFTQEEAEDLFRETYVDFLSRGCPSFDPDVAPFRPWLHTVTLHVCFRELKRRVDYPHVGLDECNELAAPEPDQEKEGGQSDLATRIHVARKRLKPVYDDAITQRVEHGLSFREMAGKSGTTEGTARMRYCRARKQLRAIFEAADNHEQQNPKYGGRTQVKTRRLKSR